MCGFGTTKEIQNTLNTLQVDLDYTDKFKTHYYDRPWPFNNYFNIKLLYHSAAAAFLPGGLLGQGIRSWLVLLLRCAIEKRSRVLPYPYDAPVVFETLWECIPWSFSSNILIFSSLDISIDPSTSTIKKECIYPQRPGTPNRCPSYQPPWFRWRHMTASSCPLRPHLTPSSLWRVDCRLLAISSYIFKIHYN